jgi:hypothetical protein
VITGLTSPGDEYRVFAGTSFLNAELRRGDDFGLRWLDTALDTPGNSCGYLIGTTAFGRLSEPSVLIWSTNTKHLGSR